MNDPAAAPSLRPRPFAIDDDERHASDTVVVDQLRRFDGQPHTAGGGWLGGQLGVSVHGDEAGGVQNPSHIGALGRERQMIRKTGDEKRAFGCAEGIDRVAVLNIITVKLRLPASRCRVPRPSGPYSAIAPVHCTCTH